MDEEIKQENEITEGPIMQSDEGSDKNAQVVTTET